MILCPGTHRVCSTGGLEEGGSIRGNKNVNIIGIVTLMQEGPVSNEKYCVLFNQFSNSVNCPHIRQFKKKPNTVRYSYNSKYACVIKIFLIFGRN